MSSLMNLAIIAAGATLALTSCGAKHVATTARLMGWGNRLRVGSVPPREGVPHSLRMDAELESLGGNRNYVIGEYA